jgi:autotransporter family porin
MLGANMSVAHAAPHIATAATSTLPPGAQLPTGNECAAQLERNDWEARPENAEANHTVPPDSLQVPPWPDYFDPRVNTLIVPRIDGKFEGTTDEIIRWGACKWGIDTQLVRAIAVEESNWRQDKLGDFVDDQQLCVGNYTSPCPTSFGLLQVKATYRPGSYPYSQLSTSYNVDYGLAAIRACYEGLVSYLHSQDYGAGDIWGCIGWHFSGYWKDALATRYIQRVHTRLEEEAWRNW